MRREKVLGVMLLFRFLLIKATIGRPPIAKHNCSDTCGNVTIPYPFGIGFGCFANHTFSITCNNSKPFLNSINLEVLEIRLETSTIRVNGPVSTSDCSTSSGISSGRPRPYLNLSATPFSFNNIYNIFTGIGCDSMAQLFDATTTQGNAIVGCSSMCSNDTGGNGCYGTNCCQTKFPPISSKVVTVSFSSIASSSSRSGCNYGFLVEEEWFSNLTHPFGVEARQNVPLVLDWSTDEMCYYEYWFQECSDWYQYCRPRKQCYCEANKEGNPYLENGCKSRSHTPY